MTKRRSAKTIVGLAFEGIGNTFRSAYDWHPRDVDGAFIYYDMESINAKLEMPVSEITDSISLLHARQSNSNYQATYKGDSDFPKRYIEVESTRASYPVGGHTTFNFLHQTNDWTFFAFCTYGPGVRNAIAGVGSLNSDGRTFAIDDRNNANDFQVYGRNGVGTGVEVTWSGVVPNDSDFHSYIVRADRDGYRLYIDGEFQGLENSISINSSDQQYPFKLCYDESDARAFQGKLGNLFLANRACKRSDIDDYHSWVTGDRQATGRRTMFVTAMGEHDIQLDDDDQIDSALHLDDFRFEYKPYLLSSNDSVDTRVEPFNANMQFSTVAVQLPNKPEVGELLQSRARRAESALSEDMGADADEIHLEDTTLSRQIIFVGGETIWVGAHKGGGEYSAQRGLFASRATAHRKGDNVFTKVPYWRGRAIHMYTLDLNDPGNIKWVPRWIGRIDGAIKTTDDGTRLRLLLREGLASFDQAHINTDQPTINNRYVEFREDPRADGKITVSGRVNFESRVTKPDSRINGVWIQVDETLHFARAKSGDIKVIERRGLGSPAPEREPDSFSINEVFVVDKRLDKKLGSGKELSSTADLKDVSSTVDGVQIRNSEVYPYHPLAIFAALTLSSSSDAIEPDKFNVLRSPFWSSDLQWVFEEDIVKTIHELIQRYPDLQVDRVLLGWDGEPVNGYTDLVRKFLHPFGFYIGLNNHGLLTLSRVKLPDVDDVEEIPNQKLQAIPDLLEWTDGTGKSAEAVSATIGELPWGSSTNILARAVEGGHERSSIFVQSPDVTFDMSTIRRSNEKVAVDLLTNRLLIQHFEAPILTIRVEDHLVTGQDYSLGAIVNIKDLPVSQAVLPDKEGKRVVNLEDNEDFYGYIVGRRFNFNPPYYELSIMLVGDKTIRWRAPSMVVSSFSSGSNSIECSSRSQFGDSDSDNHRFNAGDEIQIWTRSGTLRDSNSATIDSIGVRALNLTGWPFATDPQVGDIVRLAHLGDYTNTSVKDQTELAYTFMANIAGLGSQIEDHHEYG